MTPTEIAGYILLAGCILLGAFLYEIGARVIKKIRDNRQYKKWEQEREHEEAFYNDKKMKEIEEDLGNCGWLEWTLNGGVIKDKMVYYLKHLIWGEDRENLAYLQDHVRSVMRDRKHNVEAIPLESIIYLVRVDERAYDSGDIFEITMHIGILPTFIPDVDERRLCINMIINQFSDGIHDTHGDAGEMDLNVWYRACVEEDEI